MSTLSGPPPEGNRKRQACSANVRLLKATFLAMLGDPPLYGEQYSVDKQRAFFEKIPDANWTIVSFNPLTKKVCVEITDGIGTRTVAVTLKDLTVDSIKN